MLSVATQLGPARTIRQVFGSGSRRRYRVLSVECRPVRFRANAPPQVPPFGRPDGLLATLMAGR
jgi:hypothetical protein